MHTVAVTFTHLSNTLGMLGVFEPAVESLFRDRMTGATVTGYEHSPTLIRSNLGRFFTVLPFHDGTKVSLIAHVDLADPPITESESLNPTQHKLIVTAATEAEALAIAEQVIDLMSPEEIIETDTEADSFPYEHEDTATTMLAWRDADGAPPADPGPTGHVTMDDVKRRLAEIIDGE